MSAKLSTVPHSERMAAVSVDAYVFGAQPAEMRGRTIQFESRVAMITGERHVLDHAEKPAMPCPESSSARSSALPGR